MIQTMTSVRSDMMRSTSPPRLTSYLKDGCIGFPPPPSSPPPPTHQHQQPHQQQQQQQHSSCFSTDQGNYSASQYTRDLRQAVKSDFRVRNRGCLLKSRSRDHIDERLSPEMIRFTKNCEPVKCSREERDVLREPAEPVRTASNYQGYQQQQGLWVRTGSDVGTNCRYSNDCFDADEDDVDPFSPPKITPVSGKVLPAIDRPLVRPIPYKPIAASGSGAHDGSSSSVRRDSSQNSSLDRQAFDAAKRTPHSADEGYGSRDWQNLSSSSSVSQNSFAAGEPTCGVDRKPSKSSCDGESSSSVAAAVFQRRRNSGTEKTYERTTSERNSCSSCSRRRGLSFTQTPSPSDSGVGELEALLREKDLELQTLRDTMERNEVAMMQVFEEKQQNWQLELGDAVQEWQLKLRSHQQKSFRTEQGLLLQIFKLQQENRNLRQSLERANESNGQTQGKARVEEDLENVRKRLEELVWEQKQSKSEIDVLRAQLKIAAEDVSSKSMELISAQLVAKDNEIEIDCKNTEIHRLLTDLNQLKRELSKLNEQKMTLECCLSKLESSSSSSKNLRSSVEDRDEAEKLKIELNVVRKELDQLRSTLERERAQWYEEKTKVINYQKHLQLNYIQMARKNKLLEIEVQQMTSELERHDVDCEKAAMDESYC